jgi:hypothetical protein
MSAAEFTYYSGSDTIYHYISFVLLTSFNFVDDVTILNLWCTSSIKKHCTTTIGNIITEIVLRNYWKIQINLPKA